MLDFLTLSNISNKTIDAILKNNTQSKIGDLSFNDKDCIKIIEYMRQIGFKCIDDLLINYLNVFIMDYDDFVKKISKLNIPYFVQCVNDDISSIEFIYN